ncbi:MAG: hypothetical protein SCM96_02660 [Acidobacteriota bacterium]|nr:hypothetical protein [Acidobacteriota bacterium]
MKKALIFILIGVLLGAAAGWAFIRYVLPLWQPSHVDNTFYETTSKLDKGGEVFVYLHAEQVMRAVVDALDGFDKALELMPEEHKVKARPGLDMARIMFESYGLDEISGVGISSFSFKPGLRRVRLVLHHRPGKDQGLIWNAAGAAARSLDELNLLPADTALAVSQDADIAGLIEWASRFGSRIGDAEGKNQAGPSPDQAMALMKGALQMAGIDFDRLMASYGGRFGYLITLDTEKRVAIPAKDKPVLIPEPAFALFIHVKDDYIFDTIKAKAPESGKPPAGADQDVRKIVFPPILAPFPVEPAIAQKGGWLVAASRPSLLDAVLSGMGPRLSADKDFKEIAARLPRKGNGFSYVSPRLMRAAAQAMRENLTGFPASSALARIAGILDQSKGLCQVREVSERGIVATIHHGFDVASLPELVDALAEIARKSAQVRKTAAPAPPDEEPPRRFD